MYSLFYRNTRLLALALGVILVAGVAAYIVLPRMEDPPLTPRAATLTTIFPGADAERVESLVTEKIEEELKEIEEIKEVRSTSRASVSFIAVELRDDVDAVRAATLWGRIRDKAADAAQSLPAGCGKPEFQRLDVKAHALIVALTWDRDGEPQFALLRRLLKQLKEQIDAVPGVERSELFGDPGEEILVSIRPEAAAARNLNAAQISRQIFASDAKVAAGQMRSGRDEIQLEVSGELDTLTRLSRIPIQLGEAGAVVELSDLAAIEKTVRQPAASKIVLRGRPAVALGVLVRSAVRLDNWSAEIAPLLEQFESDLPPGVGFVRVFEQNPYVVRRMESLLTNLIYGGLAVVATVLALMGRRCALIVGFTLPLTSLAVLAAMHWLGVPIHQMSVTGLIIALGLLIDNAIIVVDEIARQLREGRSPLEAVRESCRFLAIPMIGSTLTTILSFGPIALMPGPSGEFVGSIGTVTIISVACSMVLALTVIAALAGHGLNGRSSERRWHRDGVSVPRLRRLYERTLDAAFARPVLTAAASLGFCLAGFAAALTLPEQFFPPADRKQFQIELELPAASSMAETERAARAISEELSREPDVRHVAWFLGESAPVFYYNVIPDRKNTPRYGQAIVDCDERTDMRSLIRRVQTTLEQKLPEAGCLARQLEQGPPFSAPIEIRIFGPDAERLRELGEQVRLAMSETPDVLLTRSEMSETLAKITFAVDERQARMAGLDHLAIAAELDGSLEGIVGGSILEGAEEIPVRVRASSERRADLNQIASLDLLASGTGAASGADAAGARNGDYHGVPVSAIASTRLDLDVGGVTRLNGRRMNEVQAFVRAGVLPADVLRNCERRLAASGFRLPPGYSRTYGGVEAKRDDAIGNLIANTAVLVTLMIATLVLSFGSFRMATIIFVVGAGSIGLGLGSLWLAGCPWGFMSIVGIMGMVGVAINDSIVVLSVLLESPPDRPIDPRAMRAKIVANTRHILATTLTTIFGFTPLLLDGGEFWPPVAISISGGVGGATFLALFFVPCAFVLVRRGAAVDRPLSPPAPRT